MKNMFNLFDEDRSGSIGHQEFKELCIKLDPMIEDSAIEAALLQIDANGDGDVDQNTVQCVFPTVEEPMNIWA